MKPGVTKRMGGASALEGFGKLGGGRGVCSGPSKLLLTDSENLSTPREPPKYAKELRAILQLGLAASTPYTAQLHFGTALQLRRPS